MGWEKIPFARGAVQNVTATALKAQTETIENAFVTDADSLTRWPGLVRFAELGDGGRAVLREYKGDLMAATSGGRLYRIGSLGTAVVSDVTTFGLVGAGRPVFAETDQDLLIAAGGPIVAFAGNKTRRLSTAAPDAISIAYIGGIVTAIEPRSGRFQHTPAGQYQTWNPLDSFAAEGNPDALTAMVATTNGRLLLCGPKSIEAFEQSAEGDRPFFRRSVLATGVFAPYTLTDDTTGTFAVLKDMIYSGTESGGTTDLGRSVQYALTGIDDWRDAWGSTFKMDGQVFALVQAPYATTPFDTQGMTMVLDIARKGWIFLYGWDADLGRPARWPGWSITQFNGRLFVGGEGVVYEMRRDIFDNDGQPMRSLWRGGHIDATGVELRVDDVRIRLERGRGAMSPAVDEPVASMRINRDNRGFGRYKRIGMGRPNSRHLISHLGAMGYGRTLQFEISMTDRVPFEMSGLEIDLTAIQT